MKRLLTSLTILTILVTGICLSVGYWYDSVSRDKLSYIKHIWVNPSIPDTYQVVSVGNSHAQSGMLLKHYNVKTLNLSSVAQRFSLDFALLKQHSKEIGKGAIILIPVTPISFAHKTVDEQDSLQANYYDELSPFLISHLNISNYLQSRIVPFVRSGYLLRKLHSDTVRERISREQKGILSTPTPVPVAIVSAPLPAPVHTATGSTRIIPVPYSAFDFPPEEYKDNTDFLYQKWYQTDEFNVSYFPSNRKDLQQIIDFSIASGWRPVLVTIPISDAVKQKLRPDFMNTYLYENLNKINAPGIPYLDFTDDKEIASNSAYFSNADHLNQNGAALFSYKLLLELIKLGYLPPSANGYQPKIIIDPV